MARTRKTKPQPGTSKRAASDVDTLTGELFASEALDASRSEVSPKFVFGR